jgi:hypothetical protein
MPMKLRALLILLVLPTACALTPTPTPPPTNTLTPVDDLAAYRPALNAANSNDLALVDRPTRYTLTLTYAANPPTLTGSQEVVYFNRQTVPLNEIYFRLFANYLDYGAKITVTHVSVNGAAVTPSLEAKETALRVPLTQPLMPNASVNLHLDFAITIPRASNSRYGDLGASDYVTLLPSVYPLIPGYDAKGWHIEMPPSYGDLVYADASFYSITIATPAAITVIASGTTIDTRDSGNGTKTWKIVGAPMRDFDINLTSQLQKASETSDGITINSYYEPSDAESGKKALRFAADALRVFQSRFGAYPYAEFDVVETPISALGIEYPGVIVLAQSLYKNPRDAETFEFVVAHEVSHQWWYGIVGDDQVNYPWVDESLAQYSEVVYTEDMRGKTAGQMLVRGYFGEIYNQVKSGGRDAAVNQPVAAFTESSYSEIVYGKGPLFYDAIRKRMGDEKFMRFLKTYAERYRYKVAFPEDILKTAEEVCACSLREEYQQWILSPAK